MSARKSLKHLFVVAGLALGAGFAPGDAAADDGAVMASLIVVQGTGEVRVRPDSLRVEVGVEARASTLGEARGRVNERMRKVIEAVQGLEVPDLTVETSYLDVSPIYAERRGSEPPAIVGYSASNHVSVRIERAPAEDLAEHGARVIDAAMRAGANTLGGISFFLADPAAAEDEALAAAVRDAAHEAEVIAGAAGVSLGAIHSVEESPGLRMVPRALRPEALAATPIEVGDVVVQDTVTARFLFR